MASAGTRADFYRAFLDVIMGRLDQRTKDVSSLRAALDNAQMSLHERG